jgi:peptide subunit release factor 1 (eRF1)
MEAILNDTLRGIMHHGDTGNIGFFSAYLLKAVQTHMSKQGDRYYEEAKALRNIAESALSDLTKKQKERRPDALDPTTSRLGELNNLVRGIKPGRRKKPASNGTQLDLF